MGNEGSKPVAEEGATVFYNVARDLTPPPGTGRYAGDDNVKAEPGTSSPLRSSLNVGTPDKRGAKQFHHGLPDLSSPERKHTISASNPEFHHELPHLSSPNRVRPPSPPPATEPAPFVMPDIIDGLPQMSTSSPNEKKPTLSRKKQRALAALAQNQEREPASPPPASSAFSAEAVTPQGLTKAQRKELKRQRRIARKSGANSSDFSPSLYGAGAGDTIPEESLPAPVQEPQDGSFDATQDTAPSSKKKKNHVKHIINGLQISRPENRASEPTDQPQEPTNGIDAPHEDEEEDTVTAPHMNGARDMQIDSGDESVARRKRKQAPQATPSAKQKQAKKVRVAHESDINGGSLKGGAAAHAQVIDEEMPDASRPVTPETGSPRPSGAGLGVVNGHLKTTSPDGHAPDVATPQEPPSTAKRRKRKGDLRRSKLQDAEGNGISTPGPALSEHLGGGGIAEARLGPLAAEDARGNSPAISPAASISPAAPGSPDRDLPQPTQLPLPHAPTSDPETREEIPDDSIIGGLGPLRPINRSTTTRKRHDTAAKTTDEADSANGGAIVATPKTQSSRKRLRKTVDLQPQVGAAAVEAPASAGGSPNQEVPAPDGLSGDDAANGTISRQELASTPQRGDQAESSQSGRRSTRKRVSRPSYFEREAQSNKKALEELPAPEAATPLKKLQRTARTGPLNMTSAASPTKRKTKEKRSKNEYASGAFTAQENAAIKRAVEEFRVENGMSQVAINTMIHENPASIESTDLHRQLWEKVLPACPDRRRQKIILRARAMFHNFAGRGVFTEAQDEQLRRLVERMGQKWTEIGKIVDRNPLDLRDRWRNYAVCGDKRKTAAWDEAEVSRLVDLVMDAINTTLRSRGQELSDEESREQAEKDVPWDIISKHMDRTRSAKQCREKWTWLQARQAQNSDGSGNEDDVVGQALEKTRADLRKMTPADKHALIRAIHETHVSTDEKIPWPKLGDAAFRKRWNRDTLRIMWSRLRPTVSGHEHLSTRSVAEALLDSYDRDQVLTQLEDGDVDDDAEASILGATSIEKRSRTSRKSSASGAIPSASKKKKRQHTEEDTQEKEDSGGEGASGSSAKGAKTPKRRRAGGGLGVAQRLSAQLSSARASQLKRPRSSAGVQLSKELVENSDDSDGEDERTRSPEVPASPEPPKRLTPGEKATVKTSQLGNDNVASSHSPADDAEGDADEDDDDVRAETESVDLGAQPGSSEKLNGIHNGVSVTDDILSEAEPQDQKETSTPAAISRKRQASPTFSPAFAHGRFKKQRPSMQTYSSKKTPRTPFSARRRAFADVYDDIEEAHGESSQPEPASAKKSAGKKQGASARPEPIAGKVGEGRKLAALESDSGSEMEDIPATLPKFTPRNAEDAGGSEEERRRLAQESDEDSDMEDIPARLPGTAEDSG
ncbi:hypothetical protein RB595_000155 [Gaeumannomyces hyphopodioides]